MTIGCVMNVYNEHLALPGALECASSFFDEVVIVHAGPGGRPSTDGTMEILEKWGGRFVMASVDQGFGILRTRCMREMKTDWTLIMDADERFRPVVPIMDCHGDQKYPDFPNPDVSVSIRMDSFNQGDWLRERLSNNEHDCLRMCRRHWFDGPASPLTRPCQNWQQIPDWQLRCVRNTPYLFFLPERKMHEHLKDSRTWEEPGYQSGDQLHGPFFEHYHCFFKPLEAEQNAEDMAIYNGLDKGLSSDMWLQNAEGVKCN